MPKTKLLTAFITLFLAGLATAQTAPNPGHIGTQVNVLDPSQTGTPQTNLQTALNNIFATIGSGGGSNYWIQTPDRNLYYNAGNVGIGTASPVAKLHLVDENNAGWRYEQYNNGDGTNFRNYRARGSIAIPLPVSANDRLAAFLAGGYHSGGTFSSPMAGMNIVAAENFTPTTQGTYLTFVTSPIRTTNSQQERMRITPDGNVGIGTTNPGAKLDVQTGAVRIHTAGSDLGRIEFKRTSDSWHMGTIEVSHTGNYGGDLSFKLHPNNGVVGTAPATVMFLQSSGNVGIGIPPISRLHLDKAGSGNYVRFSEEGILRGVVGVSGGGSDLLGSDSDNDFVVRGESNIKFGVGAAQRMIIDSAGNVGIGTASPGARLEVYGNGVNTDTTSVRLTNVAGKTYSLSSGIYQASEYGFSIRDVTAGTIPFVIDTSGNVGIGRTNPFTPLHVTYPYPKTDTTTRYPFTISSNEASQPFKLYVGATGALALANRSFALQTGDDSVANGGNLVLQPAGGNVGIGTTGPNSKLHVIGSICAEASDTGCAPTSGYVRGTGLCIGTDCKTAWPAGGSGTVTAVTASSPLASSGGTTPNISLTGTVPVTNGGTGATTLTGLLRGNGTGAFTALTTSTGISGAITDETGTGSLVFANSPTFGGSINFPGSGIWNSSGNVGIGKNPSTYRLQVAGVIQADSSLITGGDIMFIETGNDSGLAHGGDGDVRLITNGVDKLVIDSSGVNIQNTLLKVGTNGPILHPAYIRLPASGAQPLTCDILARGMMYFDTSAGGGAQVPCVCLYVSGSWQWRPFDNLAGVCD